MISSILGLTATTSAKSASDNMSRSQVKKETSITTYSNKIEELVSAIFEQNLLSSNIEDCNTAEDIKTIVKKILDEDTLTLFTPEDIRDIFKLSSTSTARKLMNQPSFPLMRIGRRMRVTKENLIKFIKDNGTTMFYID